MLRSSFLQYLPLFIANFYLVLLLFFVLFLFLSTSCAFFRVMFSVIDRMRLCLVAYHSRVNFVCLSAFFINPVSVIVKILDVIENITMESILLLNVCWKFFQEKKNWNNTRVVFFLLFLQNWWSFSKEFHIRGWFTGIFWYKIAKLMISKVLCDLVNFE